MLHLQDPLLRLHAHQATHGNPLQQPQVSHSDEAARQLEEAKQRAIAALRRPHQSSKLSQVQGVDDDGTDEPTTSPRSSSPCPPPRVKPGEGRSLFERTSFRKPVDENGSRGVRSLEERVSWAPPTGPAADRGRAKVRYGGRGNGSAARENVPCIFGRQNAQVSEGGMAWTPENRAPSLDASTGLYQDSGIVAVKAAKIPSPLPSPWKAAANDTSLEEECVLPPAKSPPMAKWSTQDQKEESSGFAPTNGPPALDFGNNFGKRDISSPMNLCTPTVQLPISTMWTTPQTKSFTKTLQAPRPKSESFSASTNQPSSVQGPAPRSVPAYTTTTSTSQASKTTQSTYARQPHAMPQLQHLHIAPTAALSFSPPLTPPLSSSSSRPQLSTSVYLACLGTQIGRDTKVMLKCRMGMCAHRDGVTFAKESLKNGVVERYRQGFGCGGCGEMLDVVVC